MRILLTGATGFLGSHIAEILANENHEVRCLVRSTSQLSFLNALPPVECRVGSLEDSFFLKKAMQGVDAIVHNAGVTAARSSAEYYDVNVGSTIALLNAAKSHAKKLQRFVLVSSMSTTGPARGDQYPLTEQALLSPVSHYGFSKLMAEKVALAFANQIPITIIRPPIVYGPRDTKNFIFFKAISRGILLSPLGGAISASMIYAVDAARAILSAVVTPVSSGRIYFIDDGRIYRWNELLSLLAAVVEQPIRMTVPIPKWLLGIAALLGGCYSRFTGKPVLFSYDKFKDLQQLYWICESSKARQELNWVAKISWESGAKLTYNWYREKGWIR